MSETHANAYSLELAEKKAQLAALESEVATLQRFVDRNTPEEEVPRAEESTEDTKGAKK